MPKELEFRVSVTIPDDEPTATASEVLETELEDIGYENVVVTPLAQET